MLEPLPVIRKSDNILRDASYFIFSQLQEKFKYLTYFLRSLEEHASMLSYKARTSLGFMLQPSFSWEFIAHLSFNYGPDHPYMQTQVSRHPPGHNSCSSSCATFMFTVTTMVFNFSFRKISPP